MGEQVGLVRLPDLMEDLESGSAIYYLAERVKLACDLLNSGLAGAGGIYYNFMNYGGVADGVTDNTAALNALITTVTAAGGGVIYFPEGTYAFTGIVTTPDACNIRFLGDGLSSILRATVFIARLFTAGATTTFDNLNIDTGSTGTVAIVIDSGSSVSNQWARYIFNCNFSSSGGALCIQFGNTNTFTGYGTIIHNCFFNLLSSGTIFQRTGADTISNRRVFSNCRASGSAYADLGGMNGWVIVGCDMLVPLMNVGTIPENIVITGNNLSLGGGWTVKAENTTIVGNTLANNSVVTIDAACVNLAFGPNSVEATATIVVNCTTANSNFIRFPRRSYTVDILNTGGFTLGDGSKSGFVEWLGQHVSVQITLQWGSSTVATVPANAFVFSLPTVGGVSRPFGNFFPIGTGTAYNGGTFGMYSYSSASGLNMQASGMAGDVVITPLFPFASVGGEQYYFNLHYPWL